MSDFVSLAGPAFGINRHYMRRFCLFVLSSALICLLTSRTAAAEFKLKDGTIHKGTALSPTAVGVIIKLEGSGSFTPRIAWDKFSQEAPERQPEAVHEARRFAGRGSADRAGQS